MNPNSSDVENLSLNDGAAWWCKLLAKGAGVIAAIGMCSRVVLIFS